MLNPRNLRPGLLVLLLLSAAVAGAQEIKLPQMTAAAPSVIGYDAETDIGLVAGDPAPAIAKTNTEKLTAALNAQWAGGKFKFKDGTTGPVLKPIHCAAKEFFFAGTIKTSAKIGGALVGFGSRPYAMTEGGYRADQQGGAATRFTRIDGETGGSVILLRGSGFLLQGMEVKGLRWTGGNETVNTVKPRACIEVEGRDAPASGKHTLRDLNLASAQYAIYCAPGYYDDPSTSSGQAKLVPLAEGRGVHADETNVANVYCSNVESFFRCENEQAVGWSFRDIYCLGSGLAYSTTVFDIVRGGKLAADNVMLNLPICTLLRVHYPSWNTNRFSITNFHWDNFDYLGQQKGQRFTMLDYTYGSPTADWCPLDVRITGHIANTPANYPTRDLVRFNPALGTQKALAGFDRLLFDVTNLPTTIQGGADDKQPTFTRLGNWWHPNQEYFAPKMAK